MSQFKRVGEEFAINRLSKISFKMLFKMLSRGIHAARIKPDSSHIACRVGVFWSRVAGLYTAYKTRQAQHAVLRLAGKSEEELERTIWSKHHAVRINRSRLLTWSPGGDHHVKLPRLLKPQWAGGEMYNSCVELRGFFLKAGQFLGARPDFIPAPMCQALRCPPASAAPLLLPLWPSLRHLSLPCSRSALCSTQLSPSAA